ncbi:hypothetical protein [Actinosynnema sp. NPDC020468]|uniref:hypothetical protein n=1 Tax=Actinosynnema sp. NPDC020468 TaxID=3154488 RepID=UPI0033DE4C0D
MSGRDVDEHDESPLWEESTDESEGWLGSRGSTLVQIAIVGLCVAFVGVSLLLWTVSGTVSGYATAASGGGAVPTISAPPATTTSAPATPQGYRRVTGPGGIEVSIPQDWPVKPGAVPSNQQADNPKSPGDLLRFGGGPAVPGALYDSLVAAETENPTIAAGYTRVKLEKITNRADTVDWEFEYDKDGTRRHVFGRYWRLGGTDYVVYASAGAGTWSTMRPILDVLLGSVTPS